MIRRDAVLVSMTMPTIQGRDARVTHRDIGESK